MTYGTVNADNLTSSTGGVISPNITSLRNRIINGAMGINQYTSGSVSLSASGVFPLDRFRAFGSGWGSSVATGQQSSSAPAGFQNSLLITSSGTTTSNSVYGIAQCIEGQNIYDLGWGTANAKTVTLSFWVYSSLTGTFSGALVNGATNYSYVYTYSIPTANTWTQISVTIAGPTAGSWVTTNTTNQGVYVVFDMGSGSTYTTTAGAWTSGFYVRATGSSSVIATNAATWYVTGVQLEVGTQATSFDYRPYGTELALCQRYAPIINSPSQSINFIGVADSTTRTQIFIPFQVVPRTPPTGVSINNTSYFSIDNGTTGVSVTSASIQSSSYAGSNVFFSSSGGLTQYQLERIIINGGGQIQFTGCEL